MQRKSNMDDLGGFALALLASTLGFALLALTMPRHWTQVTGGEPLIAARIRVLRAAGFCALAISLVLALTTNGPSFGSALWVLDLTISATAVALILTWRPQWLRPLARVVQIGAASS